MAEEYKKENNKRTKEVEIDKKEMETEIKSRTQGSEFRPAKKTGQKKSSDTAKNADFDKMTGEKEENNHN